MKKENCNYVIPKINSGKLSITRYNPETRYRDRYWTFQTKLVKEIILKNSNPTVLIINQGKEKQKLYDYFKSQKYFVPDISAGIAVHAQVRILLERKNKNKLLIITKEQISELVLSEDLNGFNIIIDSFDLEEKWFIAKGTRFLEKSREIGKWIKIQK